MIEARFNDNKTWIKFKILEISIIYKIKETKHNE